MLLLDSSFLGDENAVLTTSYLENGYEGLLKRCKLQVQCDFQLVVKIYQLLRLRKFARSF